MAWQKGQSGNPGGRPKVVAKVRDLARQHTEHAIKALVKIMLDPKASPHARIAAANSILDRGYGKPTQHIEGSFGVSLIDALIAAGSDREDQDMAERPGPVRH